MGKQASFFVMVLGTTLLTLVCARSYHPAYELHKDQRKGGLTWRDILQNDITKVRSSLSNIRSLLDSAEKRSFYEGEYEFRNDEDTHSDSTAQLKNDPAWRQRMGEHFDFLTELTTPFITTKMTEKWAVTMGNGCQATAAEMHIIRERLHTFWGAIGLKSRKRLTREQFIKGANKVGMEDLKKYKNGKPTSRGLLDSAWFDVIDADNDGALTLRELAAAMVATDMPASAAQSWLKGLDADESGDVSRKEYVAAYHSFWYYSEIVQ